MEVSIKRFKISLKQCFFKVGSSMNDIVTKTQKATQKNEYKSIDKTPIDENLKAKRIWIRIFTSQLNQCWCKISTYFFLYATQISTNAKLLKKKQRCIHNILLQDNE
jgi:hypothetical protein